MYTSTPGPYNKTRIANPHGKSLAHLPETLANKQFSHIWKARTTNFDENSPNLETAMPRYSGVVGKNIFFVLEFVARRRGNIFFIVRLCREATTPNAEHIYVSSTSRLQYCRLKILYRNATIVKDEQLCAKGTQCRVGTNHRPKNETETLRHIAVS